MSGLGPLRLVAKGSTGLHSVEAGAKSAAELEAAPEERSVGDGRGRIPEIGKNCPAVHRAQFSQFDAAGKWQVIFCINSVKSASRWIGSSMILGVEESVVLASRGQAGERHPSFAYKGRSFGKGGVVK